MCIYIRKKGVEEDETLLQEQQPDVLTMEGWVGSNVMIYYNNGIEIVLSCHKLLGKLFFSYANHKSSFCFYAWKETP